MNIVQPKIFTDPFWLLLLEQREILKSVGTFVMEIIMEELHNKEKVNLSKNIPITLIFEKWVIQNLLINI